MKRYRSVKLDTDVEEIGLEDEIDFGEDFDVDAVDTAAAAEFSESGETFEVSEDTKELVTEETNE